MKFDERSVRHLASFPSGPPDDPAVRLALFRPGDPYTYLITHMDRQEGKARGLCVRLNGPDEIEAGEAAVPFDDPPPPPSMGYPLHVLRTWNRRAWVPDQFSSLMSDFRSEMKVRESYEKVIWERQQGATLAYAEYCVAREAEDPVLLKSTERAWERSVSQLSRILTHIGIDVAVLGDPAFETRSEGQGRRR